MSHHPAGCFRASQTWSSPWACFTVAWTALLMGMAETLSAKWARPLEHKVTVCKSCTSAGHCGSLGSFQLPDSAAIAERTSAASLLCCAPSKNSEASRRESGCFDTGGAVFFPATSPSVQLGSNQTLYRRVKALQKPSQGNKSKLHWKDRVTGVILDRKFHKAYQDNTEEIAWFPSHWSNDSFSSSLFENVHSMWPGSCLCIGHRWDTRLHTGKLWHIWVSCRTAFGFLCYCH